MIKQWAQALHDRGKTWLVACAWIACMLWSRPAYCGDSSASPRLLLLSANLLQDAGQSDPVVLYARSSGGQLEQVSTIIQAMHNGGFDVSPIGVYSVHEIGPYLIIDYPHLLPRYSVFVPKNNPQAYESVDLNPKNLIADMLGHLFSESSDGSICDLWPLSLNSAGAVTDLQTTLHGVCVRPGTRPVLKTDDWEEYKNLRFDGSMYDREVALLSAQDGRLIGRFLGQHSVDLGAMPPGFGPEPRRGQDLSWRDCFNKFGNVACTGARGVALEAANGLYLIVSIYDDRKLTFANSNSNVFVRSGSTSQWKKLPVLPITPMNQDKLYYRLFDDWLVTSASAKLLAANHIAEEPVVPDVLTVVSTGKQWNDWGIAVEPRTAPDVATLPARRITLWNLADGRRIDLALPEDDSEVVHVFDNHQVLLRIRDKLFFAEIQDSKLTSYTLVAFDSAIPNVHWAFYSPQ